MKNFYLISIDLWLMKRIDFFMGHIINIETKYEDRLKEIRVEEVRA